MSKCHDCGNEEVVEIRNGFYFYMCPTCAKCENEKTHKPEDIRCPKCGCYAYTEVILSGDLTDEGLRLADKLINLPERPSEKFVCKGCGKPWVNPEFERYLLQRNIRESRNNLNVANH